MSERILAAELIGTELLITARHVAHGEVPKPRSYFAGLAIFAGLSGLALISDESSKLAAGVGGLVLIGAAISFPEFFTWVATAAGGPGFAPAPPKPPAHHTIVGPNSVVGKISNFLAPGSTDTRKWLCQHVPGLGHVPGFCK